MKAQDAAVTIETKFGPALITEETLDDLSSFCGLSRPATIERLRTYRYGKMAGEWAQAHPQTPDEMRAFYGATDAYVWSLTLWQAAGEYAFYERICDRLAERQRPSAAALHGQTLRALDYGSGIGASALRLAKLDYHVTIADVPGVTFDYARHRLTRRGVAFNSVRIESDLPDLGPDGLSYDAIVCFDVLEHVRAPDRVFRHMTRALRPGGLISVIAPFEQAGSESAFEGYHLEENARRWSDGRWNKFLSGQGWTQPWGDLIWRRTSGLPHVARWVRYQAWRATGKA